jgi:succinate dehydrogenase/fumarate reductase flavoprotein subunit
MMAAIEARKEGADVALVSKGALGKECSTQYASVFRIYQENPATVKNLPGYDSKPGKYIEDRQLVRALFEEAPRQIENLISLGVPMIRVPGRGDSDRDEMWRVRGAENAHGGAIVLDILAQVAENMGIRVVEGCTIMGLLEDDTSVVGASGLLRDGSWLSIFARAVILATGGGGGMSEVPTTTREVAGNGYAIALRAGLQLKNMEFNTFYAVALPTPTGRYLQCHPAMLTMTNVWLANDRGEDIVRKHFGISLQEAVPPAGIRFDWIPRAVAAELTEGRVWVDMTRVPQENWDKLADKYWKLIKETGVDVRQTPLPILPMSHFFGGGLIVDTAMRTSLEGLYAAGEVVGGRRAEEGLGNLPSCLTMGAIAGKSAAAGLQGIKAPPEEARDEGLELAHALLGNRGKSRPVEVGDKIRSIVYRYANPFKSSLSLQEGLGKLDLLEEASSDLSCEDTKELKEALETKAMFLASKAVLLSSLLRTESRGGFYRHDFPTRDDERWLRPILVHYEAESGEVKVKPGEKISPEKA